MKRVITTGLGTDARLGAAAQAGGLLVPLLYTWLIPHLDHLGIIVLDPATIRLQVVPNLPVSQAEIADAISALVNQGLVEVRHAGGGELYLQFPPAVFNEPPYLQARRAAQTRPSAIGRDQPRSALTKRDQPRSALTKRDQPRSAAEVDRQSDPPLPPPSTPSFSPSLSPPPLTLKEKDTVISEKRDNGPPVTARTANDGRKRILAATQQAPKRVGVPLESPMAIPPAVEAYREITRIYPVKSWWAKVDSTVSFDLERWRRVVLAYVGQGWNKGNIANMLSFFERGEMPGPRNGHATAEAPAMTEKAAGWLRMAGRS